MATRSTPGLALDVEVANAGTASADYVARKGSARYTIAVLSARAGTLQPKIVDEDGTEHDLGSSTAVAADTLVAVPVELPLHGIGALRSEFTEGGVGSGRVRIWFSDDA